MIGWELARLYLSPCLIGRITVFVENDIDSGLNNGISIGVAVASYPNGHCGRHVGLSKVAGNIES